MIIRIFISNTQIKQLSGVIVVVVFDFVYEPKITPKNNRSTKIAEISFYDVDKVLCEVVLLAYIDKKCLYSVDVLKLGDSDFIQLPNDEKDFVKISDINNALNGN